MRVVIIIIINEFCHIFPFIWFFSLRRSFTFLFPLNKHLLCYYYFFFCLCCAKSTGLNECGTVSFINNTHSSRILVSLRLEFGRLCIYQKYHKILFLCEKKTWKIKKFVYKKRHESHHYAWLITCCYFFLCFFFLWSTVFVYVY